MFILIFLFYLNLFARLFFAFELEFHFGRILILVRLSVGGLLVHIQIFHLFSLCEKRMKAKKLFVFHKISLNWSGLCGTLLLELLLGRLLLDWLVFLRSMGLHVCTSTFNFVEDSVRETSKRLREKSFKKIQFSVGFIADWLRNSWKLEF